jgi:hypothetical protein
MARSRVHILSAVNAAHVSKAGATYTIRDVCGCVDGLVMNQALYPAEQLAGAAPSLNGKPAPAGHPKDAEGRVISATNGDALLTSYIGAVCKNARHEGGRTLVDVVVNEAQARAHPDGQRLLERLDAAITGNNAEPIHVSTGLFAEMVTANGESGGKKYSRIATGIKYDHLAILLNESGAGTPDDGVGMWLNAAGEPEPIEVVTVNTEPEDKRSAGLVAWLKRLLIGNSADEMSFDAIQSGLSQKLPEGAWLREVFDRYAIWTDRDSRLWQQDYTISSDGSLAFAGQAKEVRLVREYHPVTNHKETDSMKPQIVAALNAAGITTDGLDDAQLLSAYNSLVIKPHTEALTAANSKIAGFEADIAAAQNAERDTLAAELAVNSSLTVDDLKALPLARLKELRAKAAPVVVGNCGGNSAGDEFAGYDMNAHLKEGK